MGQQPLLSINNLSISFPEDDGTGRNSVIRRVSFELARGDTLGIVGESGSGKTMIGRSILGLLPPAGRVDEGRIDFDGVDLLELPEQEFRSIRGKRIGMIFQEPMTSLNPSLTIGRQLTEGLMLHEDCDRTEADRQAVEMLGRVQIAEPESALRAYPHVFSGGMRQRIMLASVLMLKPDLLIADEPTTALDALIQKEVLNLMMALVNDLGTALILISHDLPLVAKYANHVAVMRRGELVETGQVDAVMTRPQHSYTETLLQALPVRRPQGSAKEGMTPTVEVSNLSVIFEGRRAWPWSDPNSIFAVDDVSFAIKPGEVVGLVGESGSGKTTLGRAILDLVPVASGAIKFDGNTLGRYGAADRQDVQIIFQDPYSSLNPRMTVRQIAGESLRHSRNLSTAEKNGRLAETLDAVHMPLSAFGERYPHELSGGQRQRVCIARAIVMRPRLVIADEPVSALDLTVQSEILSLFRQLQKDLGFSALFISHDIAVVEEIADRIIVMFRGRIVESGGKEAFFRRPSHPYTRKLLSAVPELVVADDGGCRLQDRQVPDVLAPEGYLFSTPADPRELLVYRPVAPGHEVSVVPDH